jgi:hypothetical protein
MLTNDQHFLVARAIVDGYCCAYGIADDERYMDAVTTQLVFMFFLPVDRADIDADASRIKPNLRAELAAMTPEQIIIWKRLHGYARERLTEQFPEFSVAERKLILYSAWKRLVALTGKRYW